MGLFLEPFKVLFDTILQLNSSLNSLLETLRNTSFSFADKILDFFGLIRYILGQANYNLLCAFVQVGITFIMYRLGVIVFSYLQNLMSLMRTRLRG